MTTDLNEKRMASYLAAMPVIQQRCDVHQTLDEAGPFSYGAKPPRKGTEKYNAMMRAKKDFYPSKPIEPKDQKVGTAKVSVQEGLADGEFDFVHMKAKVYVKRGGRPDEPMVVTKIIDDQRVKVTDETGNVVTVNIVDLAQWSEKG